MLPKPRHKRGFFSSAFRKRMISLQKLNNGFLVSDEASASYCPHFADAVGQFAAVCGESLAYRPFEMPSYVVTQTYTYKASGHA